MGCSVWLLGGLAHATPTNGVHSTTRMQLYARYHPVGLGRDSDDDAGGEAIVTGHIEVVGRGMVVVGFAGSVYLAPVSTLMTRQEVLDVLVCLRQRPTREFGDGDMAKQQNQRVSRLTLVSCDLQSGGPTRVGRC